MKAMKIKGKTSSFGVYTCGEHSTEMSLSAWSGKGVGGEMRAAIARYYMKGVGAAGVRSRLLVEFEKDARKRAMIPELTKIQSELRRLRQNSYGDIKDNAGLMAFAHPRQLADCDMSKLSAAELDAWRDDFGLVVLATLTRPVSVCMSETDTEKQVLSRSLVFSCKGLLLRLYEMCRQREARMHM